ncbi:hypothetical protein A4D02_28480 [Niastella koreensis]|uniref:Uncharacterized protein n=2 Tax=Niastella koreensis TaxID=354356 RepID=G8T8J2_NIAKG|nr:hypothetical protein [Niastella koreensis]AEW00164.1 hypothetical protein Niako_3876 [Niastella koreensis GR20-10]OQP49532.1 hypothetical protein A4D02_28480 [Niastella koreensis]
MKKYISADEIFITYGNRSSSQYQKALTAHILEKFGQNAVNDSSIIRPILEECYDWSATQFTNIIRAINDKLFVNYLFAFHESSVKLWIRVLSGEKIIDTVQISEDELAMNRRIFKLALEQTCDVTYTHSSKYTAEIATHYDEVIEDLLFLGSEIIGFAQYLAEMRMIQGTLLIDIDAEGILRLTRSPEIEAIFSKLIDMMKEDFEYGIFDKNGVNDMKDALKKCMGIDYDFAGHQIMTIKKHHSPVGWEFQTIEPGILIQNQVNQGTAKKDAADFYDGLTFSKKNKLPIKESVYKVNAMERHLFRPIIIVDENGNDRQLIGIQKWAESITVLATNGFQWNKAANEWKNNPCFVKYLEQKSDQHDSLLEDEVVKALKQLNLPFDRNIVTFSDGKKSVKVDVKGIGEMDFVWADPTRGKIIVADCKYNRARYDMLAFTADYSNFKDTYEQKIMNKLNWINQNKELVIKHLSQKYPGIVIDPVASNVEAIFIINTPTFYMYNGNVKTVCFFRLEKLILNNYSHPDLAISVKTEKGWHIKTVHYPYFS